MKSEALEQVSSLLLQGSVAEIQPAEVSTWYYIVHDWNCVPWTQASYTRSAQPPQSSDIQKGPRHQIDKEHFGLPEQCCICCSWSAVYTCVGQRAYDSQSVSIMSVDSLHAPEYSLSQLCCDFSAHLKGNVSSLYSRILISILLLPFVQMSLHTQSHPLCWAHSQR